MEHDALDATSSNGCGDRIGGRTHHFDVAAFVPHIHHCARRIYSNAYRVRANRHTRNLRAGSRIHNRDRVVSIIGNVGAGAGSIEGDANRIGAHGYGAAYRIRCGIDYPDGPAIGQVCETARI